MRVRSSCAWTTRGAISNKRRATNKRLFRQVKFKFRARLRLGILDLHVLEFVFALYLFEAAHFELFQWLFVARCVCLGHQDTVGLHVHPRQNPSVPAGNWLWIAALENPARTAQAHLQFCHTLLRPKKKIKPEVHQPEIRPGYRQIKFMPRQFARFAFAFGVQIDVWLVGRVFDDKSLARLVASAFCFVSDRPATWPHIYPAFNRNGICESGLSYLQDAGEFRRL